MSNLNGRLLQPGLVKQDHFCCCINAVITVSYLKMKFSGTRRVELAELLATTTTTCSSFTNLFGLSFYSVLVGNQRTFAACSSSEQVLSNILECEFQYLSFFIFDNLKCT